VELRQPPQPPVGSRSDGLVRALLVLILIVLVVLLVLELRPAARRDGAATPEQTRQVAAKLQAAGALEEAAALYERYLRTGEMPSETRVGIAYSLGNNYLQAGELEKALRWYYEAETLGAGKLDEELAAKIVQSLERLGRFHAAQTALESRVQLDPDTVHRAADDPVVARIGEDEIRRSEIDRALDDLPPEMAAGFASREARGEFLQKYVADELLWRKASKLQYDVDPEVQRQHAGLLKQLAVARFVEREVLSKVEVDEADLRNFFEANKERYRRSVAEGEPTQERSFEEVRPLAERDYRLQKMQSAYQQLIDSELATKEVELYPENLTSAPE
jgi:tetratricopeptide (TPR) repeat protein